MTDSFKQECKNTAYKNRYGKLELGNGDILLGSDYLSSFTIKDSCISNNIINGNITTKTLTFETINYKKNLIDNNVLARVGLTYDSPVKLLTQNNNELLTEEEDNLILEDYEQSNIEWLAMDNYTVSSENISDTTNSASYTAYGMLYKLDNVYKCNIEDIDNATVWDFYVDALTQCGLIPDDTSFLNSDLLVGGNPFTNNETIRTVISQCVSVGLYFVDTLNLSSKVKLRWFDTTVSETLTKRDYSTLVKNQVYGPIDCLVIKDTFSEGENVTRGEGSNEFVIADNVFLNTEAKKTQVIDSLWRKIQGFTYVDYSLTSYTGRPYLRKGNKITIEDVDGNFFDTYIINNEFTYDGTFKSVLSATALSATQTALKNTQSVSTKFRNVERSIDKVNGKIEDVIEESDVNYAKKTDLILTGDSIKASVAETIKGYATESEFQELNKNVNAYITSSSANIEVINSTLENGVTKVSNKILSIDDNGLTVDSDNSKTKSNTDTNGFKVIDKTGSSNKELLFAGFDETTQTSIVRSENLNISNYFTLGNHSRFENYQDGTGCFYI